MTKPEHPSFDIGQRVTFDDLATWEYTGSTGVPGVDADCRRRYRKGDRIIEVRANKQRSKPSVILVSRTAEEDARWWSDYRQRRSIVQSRQRRT